MDSDVVDDRSYRDDRPYRRPKVGLGCGTLILIALIVLIFSRASSDDLEKQVKDLDYQVRSLEATIQNQTQLLESMSKDLHELKAKLGNQAE